MLVLCCILAAVYAAVQIARMAGAPAARGTAAGAEGVILIDPGHGGMDGGASAADGTLEKDINLEIALPLADLLRFLGYPVELTRESDTSIHNAEADTIREQKVSDLKNRLSMVNASRLTISIHQNQFAQTQYSGTQIFYGTASGESAVLAESIREAVIGLLQPENTRELKKGSKDIYLLHNATAPIVLVECGFLSNTADVQKLKDPSYRQDMAFAIACGLLRFEA
ncbi:MAG TPA: N-acetylmuramoyl-L-alanine amidase [Firmicutes bacterium]|nr:N-acetylmuramoyl-L-alanine amidase [Bacillota bacterium]